MLEAIGGAIGGFAGLAIIIFIIFAILSPSDNKTTSTSLVKKQNLKCKLCESLIYENQNSIKLFSNWYHFDCYNYITTLITIISIKEAFRIEAINLIDKITKEKPTWEQLTPREKEIWNWIITNYLNSETYKTKLNQTIKQVKNKCNVCKTLIDKNQASIKLNSEWYHQSCYNKMMAIVSLSKKTDE